MTPMALQNTLDALLILPAATEWVVCKEAQDDSPRTQRRWHDG